MSSFLITIYNALKKHFAKATLAFFMAVVFFFLFLLFSDLGFRDGDSFYTRGQKATMHPEKPIFQNFKISKNDFSGIEIPLKKFNGYPDESLRVELMNKDCQKTITSHEYGFFFFLFHKSPHFNFSPIIDSAGEEYCVQITYFAKTKRKGELPHLVSSNDKRFANSSYTNMKDGRQYDGRSLIIEPTYSTGSLQKDSSTLINRMSQYKPWFFKGVFLQILFLLFFVSIITLVVLLIL